MCNKAKSLLFSPYELIGQNNDIAVRHALPKATDPLLFLRQPMPLPDFPHSAAAGDNATFPQFLADSSARITGKNPGHFQDPLNDFVGKRIGHPGRLAGLWPKRLFPAPLIGRLQGVKRRPRHSCLAASLRHTAERIGHCQNLAFFLCRIMAFHSRSPEGGHRKCPWRINDETSTAAT